MYKNKKIIAIIPARGGSRGIYKKNIIDLGGNPLIYYSIKIALECKYFDKIIVSSENSKILDISKKLGAETIRRPNNLSLDNSSTKGVIIHIINKLKKEKYSPDYIMLLQPTSPFRKLSTIKKVIKTIQNNKIKSVITVTKDQSYFWIKNKNQYRPLFTNQPRRRQERQLLYKENGNIYFNETKSFLKEGFIPKKYDALSFQLISSLESIDIDSFEDLKYARYRMNEVKKNERNKNWKQKNW